MAEDVEGACQDRFPHLRGDFTTCAMPCVQPRGHRPATPHRCADGHEWFIDSHEFLAVPQTSEP